MKKIFLIATLFAASFSMCVAQQRSIQPVEEKYVEGENRGYIIEVGDMAPDFELKADNGKVIRLKDLRGKVVMLQFTASWCGICRKEMPFIERDIWLRHRDNPDFVLVGVDLKEGVDKVKVLRDATKVTYPIALDSDGKVFSLYAEKGAGVTRNVLIDRDGRIVMLTRRYNEAEFADLCKTIDKMLKK